MPFLWGGEWVGKTMQEKLKSQQQSEHSSKQLILASDG